ncbi:MAG: 30S ribosome-binding factor RbfA [Planctomycetota bacterium]|jgi:ribosome-binding factor A
MATRRQEKVARIVKEGVSDAVMNRLNDPRIEGFISVTKVEMGPDLRSADVYFTIFGKNDSAQKKTFVAINHARSKVQAVVSERIKSKFCPVLRFHRDETFKKTIETLNIIDEAVSELKEKEPLEEV